MIKKLALFLTLVILLTLPSISAQAQAGLYGQLSLPHDSANSAWYHGFTGGLYGNMLKLGPVRLGLDGRATYATGDQYDYRSFLVGPRLQLKPPVIPFGPYIQGAIGVGGSKYTGFLPLGTHYSNKLQYGVIAGLDYTIFPHIDLRLPEIEYLRSSAVSSDSLAPATNLISLSAGIVVRLP